MNTTTLRRGLRLGMLALIFAIGLTGCADGLMAPDLDTPAQPEMVEHDGFQGRLDRTDNADDAEADLSGKRGGNADAGGLTDFRSGAKKVINRY